MKPRIHINYLPWAGKFLAIVKTGKSHDILSNNDPNTLAATIQAQTGAPISYEGQTRQFVIPPENRLR